MKYRQYTFESPNPLVRFARQTRLKTALDMVSLLLMALLGGGSLKLLDYGCGDGTFLNRLSDVGVGKIECFGFEPYMEAIEANETSIFRDWGEVANFAHEIGRFDVVTCFEVLENFPVDLQEETLHKIRKIVKDDGTIIVSVPIESGLPALVKNLIRYLTIYKGNESVYALKNVLASVFERPIPSCRTGSSYLSHMGFYVADVEALLKRQFRIDDRVYSPFRALGKNVNSQVYFVLRPSQN